MRGNADNTGVEEQKEFKLIPNGVYDGVIIEQDDSKCTGNSDPMANIKIKLINNVEFSGRIVYDRIVIPRKDSPAIKIMGRTKHFLHCIGEPYEGVFEYDSKRWLNKIVKFRLKIKVDTKHEYPDKNEIVEYIMPQELDTSTGDIPFK